MLDIGLNRALRIREERLTNQPHACRLLYVSDIHLRKRRSEALSRQVVDAAIHSAPDAILLGGDLIDRRSELGRLSQLVGRLRTVAPVLAVGGNHDRRVGLDRVASAVATAGGRWIHDAIARLTHQGRTIAVFGPERAHDASGSAGSCGEAGEVANEVATTESARHVRILCAHDPRIWKTSRHAGYDLVLAGHLHGCQLVACEYRGRLFPGAIVYPYCFVNHQAGSTRLVVSRGVSDLLPIRWRCPREVVLCHV